MYQKMYCLMFNAATDALVLLKEGKVWDAQKVLIDAQCAAEEIYISAEDGGAVIHLPQPLDEFPPPMDELPYPSTF